MVGQAPGKGLEGSRGGVGRGKREAVAGGKGLEGSRACWVAGKELEGRSDRGAAGKGLKGSTGNVRGREGVREEQYG